MASEPPVVDLSLNYEPIEFVYKKVDPSKTTDSFDFKSESVQRTAEGGPEFTEFTGEALPYDEPDSFRSGPLSDEMPEDFPAGDFVAQEFDFIL